ncbi:MAG TPA: cupredoxin domain-containing protein [Candidatus Cybelea sp.]|nr:cupredoxin domain-containing protein [Candidatus Cybelea sp.]
MRRASVLPTIVLGAAIGSAAGIGAAAIEARAEPERVIEISAMKFDYLAEPIVLKKGQPVVFVLSSLDRAHGFNMPAFKIRADIVPGQQTRVRFVPDRAGTFEFHCDNFCGDGHEDMSETFVVKD